MDMYESIKNFHTQFSYEPVVENAEKLAVSKRYIASGMGGSHLAADLIKVWKPSLDLVIHSGYGLPDLSDELLSERLAIAISYSGNTEETVDSFLQAGKKGLARAAIAVGGKLKELARDEGVPFIELPDTGIQPRMATGFSFKALLKLIGENQALTESAALSKTLNPEEFESRGQAIARRLKGFVPVIYSSERNRPIAYNWKVKFNETGKTPAFINVFPELNHNEMTSFDVKESTRSLSERFYFIILRDPEDHPKIQKRMEVITKLFQSRGLNAETVELEGKNVFAKMFSSLVLADWAAYYTAEAYGVESTEVPMVEEFKKLI